MPIKVRCDSCEKVLNAPDKLRGKTVKCPNCSDPLRIPSGKKKSREGGGGGDRPRRRPQPIADDDDFLGGLDLSNAEDRNTRICPRCATEVDDEDIDCPNCGVDIATGAMSAAKRKKMRRKGPDPKDFYAKLFPDSWKFVKKNWGLGIRSAVILSIFMTLAVASTRACEWSYESYLAYVQGEVNGNSQVTVQGDQTLITATKTNPTRFLDKFYTNDVVLPSPLRLALVRPPYMFWALMASLSTFGIYGWLLFLAMRVAEATMAKKTKMGRLQGDTFTNVALGIRATIWFPFVWLPILLIFGGSAWFMNPGQLLFVGGGLNGILGLISLFFLPVAVIHMTQRYTYNAYLLVPLLRISLKNAGALGFWVMSYLAGNFVWMGLMGTAIALFQSQLKPLFERSMAQAINTLSSNVAKFGEFMQFTLYEFPTILVVGFFINFVIALFISYGALFAMRGIGLFGYYNAETLELMNEKTKGDPVGFGPRYIAAIVDSVMWILTFFIVKNRNANLIIGLLLAVVVMNMIPFFQSSLTPILLPGALGLFMLANYWIYFVMLESSYEQCTVGKNAMSIIVATHDTKSRITLEQGNRRFIGRVLGGIPLCLGYVLAAFDKDKQALHDKIAKTQVVWRGEEVASNL